MKFYKPIKKIFDKKSTAVLSLLFHESIVKMILSTFWDIRRVNLTVLDEHWKTFTVRSSSWNINERTPVFISVIDIEFDFFQLKLWSIIRNWVANIFYLKKSSWDRVYIAIKIIFFYTIVCYRMVKKLKRRSRMQDSKERLGTHGSQHDYYKVTG